MTGEAIDGAIIIEIGTTNGVNSDSSGSFKLTLKKKSKKLLFSHIAHESMQVDISKKDEPLSIYLNPKIYSYGAINLDPINIKALIAQSLDCSDSIQPKQTTKTDTVFTVVEAREEYPGALNCFKRVFAESFYPYLLSGKIDRFGELYVFFNVNKKGQAENVRINKAVSKELLSVVTSTFQQLKFWKPALQNGKNIDIEIGFVLRYD